MEYNLKLPPQQGWQCPVCGRVMSPSTSYCPCKGNPYSGTYATDRANVKTTGGYCENPASNFSAKQL